MPTEFGAPERAGEADQQERPVTSAMQVLPGDLDEPAQFGDRDRSDLIGTHAKSAPDTRQRLPGYALQR
jgi:hypothetical protein